ncbi:hypothetical protein AGMMS49965_02370 [Bacteroidia bacterium]|nr:hypothetical protein AGMMS49965_02370 [Bacteroidia bacterium]
MKQAIIAIGLLLCAGGLNAQTQPDNEWSIYLGVGSKTHNFATRGVRAAIGGKRGIDYTRFFLPYFGMSTGVGLALSDYAIMPKGFVTQSRIIDTPPGLEDYFHLRTRYDDIKETAFLTIPLMLRFQIPINAHFFYFAVGGEYGIPVTATGIRTDYGYSDDTGQKYENMPERGFTTLPDRYSIPIGDLDRKDIVSVAAEIGGKWHLLQRAALYTGVYLTMDAHAPTSGMDVGFKVGFAFGH